MAYASKISKQEWTSLNRDKVNAQARARWKHRHSSPEKTAAYNQKTREWYQKTRDKRLEYKRAYRKANRERLIRERIQTKVSRYGLTHDQYMAVFNFCKGRCQICGEKFKEASNACIDHCHSTGVVRGLLCDQCNHAEGAIRTPENALKLYNYMMKNQLFYQGDN